MTRRNTWQARYRPSHRELLELVLERVDRMTDGFADLQAADAAEAAALNALAAQQATFLTDVADKLSGGLSEEDAETLAQEINGRVTQLTQLASDQATADSNVIGSGNPAPGTSLPGQGSDTGSGVLPVAGDGTDGTGTGPSAPVASGDGSADGSGTDSGAGDSTDSEPPTA